MMKRCAEITAPLQFNLKEEPTMTTYRKAAARYDAEQQTAQIGQTWNVGERRRSGSDPGSRYVVRCDGPGQFCVVEKPLDNLGLGFVEATHPTLWAAIQDARTRCTMLYQ